jgi:hyperosmotically inducible periplasmic protein
MRHPNFIGTAAILLFGVVLTTGCDRSTGTTGAQRIERDGQDSGKLSDVDITTNVRSVLSTHAEYSAVRISVDTTNGVVTLRGAVVSESAIEKAEAIVKALDGVVAVDNRLRIAAVGDVG